MIINKDLRESLLFSYMLPLMLISIICVFPLVSYKVILNYEHLSLFKIFGIISWASLIVVPHILFNYKKIYLIIICSVLTLYGLVQILHMNTFHIPLSSAGIFIILETNYSEAAQFIDSYKSKGNILIFTTYVVFVFLFLLLLKNKKYKTENKIISILVALIAFTPYLYNIYIGDKKITGPLTVATNAITRYMREVKTFRLEAEKRKHNNPVEINSMVFQGPQTYVLIIGESTNRNHMQLYGYGRETSPNLLQMQDELIIHQDVIASHASTRAAIRLALTFANLTNNKTYYKAYSLIDIARAAGFKTYWLSNQAPFGALDNSISIFANSTDNPAFVNLSGASGAALYGVSYDEKVLDPFSRILEEKTQKKLIVIHLMGAHASYEKRYPPRFNIFNRTQDNLDSSSSSSIKSRTIDTYDNALLYNDHIVADILRRLKSASIKNKAVSAALFLSDHGEDVYDTKDYAGHHTDQITRHVLEIPFITWVSDHYKITRKKTFGIMQKNKDKPFMTDDLIYSMIDLMGIQTDLHNANASLYNEIYKPRKRIISTNKDYDLIYKNALNVSVKPLK